jgi:hypothetical protein
MLRLIRANAASVNNVGRPLADPLRRVANELRRRHPEIFTHQRARDFVQVASALGDGIEEVARENFLDVSDRLLCNPRRWRCI